MLGDRVSLDCLVSGTPRPSIKWSIADAKIPGKFHEIQNVVKDFRLLSLLNYKLLKIWLHDITNQLLNFSGLTSECSPPNFGIFRK